MFSNVIIRNREGFFSLVNNGEINFDNDLHRALTRLNQITKENLTLVCTYIYFKVELFRNLGVQHSWSVIK